MPEPDQMHGAADGFGGEDTPHSPSASKMLGRDLPANMDIGKLDAETTRRLLDIGKRIPSLRWWYSDHPTLGCSPRAAVDAGRITEVEKLLDATSKPTPP